jgi:phage terminase Nu1 subunit (DNA packaging protein)
MHGIKDIEKTTRNELSTVFGVHPSTVSRWVARDGCPRNPDGTFDLRKVILWRLEDGDLEAVSCDNEEAQKWLTEFRRERALLAKIERKRVEGELMPTKKISQEWAKRIAIVTAALETLKNRLALTLVGKNKDEIRKILKEEVRYMREQFCQHGHYTPSEPILEIFAPCLKQLDKGGQT